MSNLTNRFAGFYEDESRSFGDYSGSLWTRRECGPVGAAGDMVQPRIRVATTRGILKILAQHHEVAKLRQENAQLREAAADEAVRILRALVEVTCAVFRSEASVFEDFDPEFPDDKFTVFAVDTPLSPQEIVAAEQTWIQTLRLIAPCNWDSVRLLIRPM